VVGGARLAGLRILVVEDEMLISMLIEDVLADHQCIVVGPFNRVAGALKAAASRPIDLAILDVNIAGTKIYPVAEILQERGIPFLFLSGYGDSAIPADRPTWRACVKPFRTEDLIAKLESLVDSR
jgi:DNA-binding response OmpR family regulator